MIQDAFGSQRHHPLPGSEDFAHVLDHIPGAFVFLGSCPPGTDPATAPSNHSTAAIFDDTVLADGARLYAELPYNASPAGRPPPKQPESPSSPLVTTA